MLIRIPQLRQIEIWFDGFLNSAQTRPSSILTTSACQQRTLLASQVYHSTLTIIIIIIIIIILGMGFSYQMMQFQDERLAAAAISLTPMVR